MVVITKFTPVLLFTQSFVHDQLSPFLQFINGKSRDLQKLLRCLSGIVTSTFKVGTDG